MQKAGSTGKGTLTLIVESLLTPQSQTESWDDDRDGSGPRHLLGLMNVGLQKRTKHGVNVLAGTNTHGFRLPPDGWGDSVPPAEIDERCFRHPPDLGVLLTAHAIKIGVMEKASGVGTDVRRFCRPPDPARVRLRHDEQCVECAGMEVRGF